MTPRAHAARILRLIREQMREVPPEVRGDVTDHLHRALWHGTLAYRCQKAARSAYHKGSE